MFKNELRKIYLNKQETILPAERKAKSTQIANLFFQYFDWREINVLHCFLPIEKFNEIDTELIFEKIWREFPKTKTVVPRVNFQTEEIESLAFKNETRLIKNQWQIDEPSEGKMYDVGKVDMVIVPLLCFDKRGFRVGYGKGFYDKFLKNCRVGCLKIGLSYFDPVGVILDAREFDVKLDFCVTTEKIVDFKY